MKQPHPKSMTCTRGSSELSSTRTFSILMSRWKTPSECSLMAASTNRFMMLWNREKQRHRGKSGLSYYVKMCPLNIGDIIKQQNASVRGSNNPKSYTCLHISCRDLSDCKLASIRSCTNNGKRKHFNLNKTLWDDSTQTAKTIQHHNIV